MQIKVVKFGGSSLADAEHFRRVADIIRSDPSRKYVVASAPGKRYPGDVKVTDMLYNCYEMIKEHEDIETYYSQIKDRYYGIISDLGLDFDISGELDAAIRRAHLSELIAERGEDYLCGEGGNGLSGGEKQRISIARSLLKRSSVLLADEVTAALDAQTSYQVTSDILNLHGMTRIIVTHTLGESLLRRYDGIFVLKDGLIDEAGSFDELMSKKGYFYALFTMAQ